MSEFIWRRRRRRKTWSGVLIILWSSRLSQTRSMKKLWEKGERNTWKKLQVAILCFLFAPLTAVAQRAIILNNFTSCWNLLVGWGHIPEQYVWPEHTAAAGSMSVGPQLQLAVLWPWLLMAMLQIRLGFSGLALVAAMEAERTLAQKAIIRVIPFKLEPLTLEGVFASIAEITPAEGKLLQVSKSLFCCTCSSHGRSAGYSGVLFCFVTKATK